MVKTMTNISEKVMRIVFMLSATVSILAVIVICYFLADQGLPAMVEIGVSDFLTGTLWKPLEGHFGIFPMIVGSIYVTAGAIILGVPVGLLCAIFMAKFCPRRIYSVLKPAVDLLAGIPSIVYGFFALMVIVPIVQDLFGGKVCGILRPGGNYHCYNVIGDRKFDLTSEQFGDEILCYEDNPEQQREVHFAKEEKRLRYTHARPFTKESLLYREIFEKYYPGQSEMIVDFWMPNRAWQGCDVNDPSARVLSNYGASGK